MKTVNLTVTLDTSGNPAVGLTSRNQTADPNDTIKWQRQGGSTFDIATLEPNGTGQAFTDVTTGGNGQWLCCTFSPTTTTPNTPFPYTLTVTSGRQPYNTDQQDPDPDVGRPVIRN